MITNSENINKVAIVELPNANVRSWVNFLSYYAIDTAIVNTAPALASYRNIILPGVGHFSDGAQYLLTTGIGAELKKLAETKNCTLVGICLGMHLLYESSLEGSGEGIGLFKGQVADLSQHAKRSTNIGWRYIDTQAKTGEKVYFNHSYFVPDGRPETFSSSSYMGMNLSAIVRNENVVGIQFHPEKSYYAGLKILRIFIDA